MSFPVPGGRDCENYIQKSDLAFDPTYNKRQGKVFQCNAISQKLDGPES